MKDMFSWSTRNVIRVLLAIAAVFIIFLIFMSLSDYKPDKIEMLQVNGDVPEIPSANMEFTIVTWNLGYFGLGQDMDFFYDGGNRVRPGKQEYEKYEEGGLGYIQTLKDIDFILFQEVDRRSKRSYKSDQYARISGMLDTQDGCFAMNYDVLFVPVPLTRPMGKVKSGIALFSRYRSSESYRGALPGKYAWPKQLFMLDRCYILSRFPLPGGKDLVVINTHNEAFDEGHIRDKQMRELRQVMFEENDRGNYVVAGGDWNMNPAGYISEGFDTGDTSFVVKPELDPRFFRLKWSWVFDPRVPTNRSVVKAYQRGHTPTTIIDFFVTSPNIEVLEVSTTDLQFRWSDHQPVMMRFRLKE